MTKIVFSVACLALIFAAYYAGASAPRTLKQKSYPDVQTVWTEIVGSRGDFVGVGTGAGIGFRIHPYGNVYVTSAGSDHVIFEDRYAKCTVVRPYTQLYLEVPQYHYRQN